MHQSLLIDVHGEPSKCKWEPLGFGPVADFVYLRPSLPPYILQLRWVGNIITGWIMVTGHVFLDELRPIFVYCTAVIGR